jgi:hypothetical protein
MCLMSYLFSEGDVTGYMLQSLPRKSGVAGKTKTIRLLGT